ncbi:hypothetical protein C8Q77DRAFT_1152481 [Trametes polyzona]|nr:hypothetical protein C8Q77DRAFT_1152481 [Trametes polyzona]
MWKTGWTLLPPLLLLWPLQTHAANFTFSYGAASECDDFQISWTGGKAPFQLTLAPPYGTPRTIDIPATSITNGRGTFNTTLPFPAKSQFLAIMSDSTGFASGGVSRSIAVGASISKRSCNTTDPGVDFFYEVPLALTQCRLYTFTGYDKAVQPITIQAVIPGGSSFVLNPPRGSTSYDWITDVAQGTSLAFIVTDAQGRQGGSSQIYLVGMSDDASCLSKNSPASVTNAPSRTTPPVAKPTRSTSPSSASSAGASATASSAPDTGSSSKTNGGTIAAAIVGCLVAAFIVGTLIWFYLRRQRGAAVFKGGFFRKFQKKEIDLMHDPTVPPPATINPYPLYHPQGGSQADVNVYTPNSTAELLPTHQQRPSGDPFGEGSVYTPSSAMFAPPVRNSIATSQFPPTFQRGSMYEGSVHGSAVGRPEEGSAVSWDQTVTSGMRRKAAAAGVSPYAPSTRFILHTDIEDDLPPPPEDEVIELPPQYSERRNPPPPIAGLSSPGVGPSTPPASRRRSRPSRLSDPPPPPSPTVPSSSSPGLAYLSNRNSASQFDRPSEPSRPS